jgi:hypothetical protein
MLSFPMNATAGSALAATVLNRCGVESAALALAGGAAYGLVFGTALQCAISAFLALLRHHVLPSAARGALPGGSWRKMLRWLLLEAAYLLSGAWALGVLVSYGLAAWLSWLLAGL